MVKCCIFVNYFEENHSILLSEVKVFEHLIVIEQALQMVTTIAEEMFDLQTSSEDCNIKMTKRRNLTFYDKRIKEGDNTPDKNDFR